MNFLLTNSPAELPFPGSQSDVSGDALDDDVSDVEMDAILWSNLPDSLVDRIAASLPLPSLFRFRAVCKRFNSNMSEQSFLDTYENARKHAPHFLILVEGADGMAGLIYSLVFHRWFKMPLPIFDTLSKFDVVASSGGLLCLRNRESNALMVCNPLTCSFRTLPPLLRIKEAFETGMAMERNGKEYRIIVWRDDNLGPVTEVYTSKSNDWTLKSNMQIRGDALSDSGVVCGDFFYVLVIYEEFLSVFAYEIEEDSWQELQASIPTDILYGYLINHWNTLLLVGAIGKNFPAKGISVWKLSPTRSAWIPILSMPSALFESLTKNFHRYDAFNCAGHGDHICFVADRHSKALIYDFSRAAWHWSPHYRASNSQQQIVGVEFRFNAVP